MTSRESDSDGEQEILGRAFYDIAQLLETAEDSDARVVRALELLRSLVPYEQCALLEAMPERAQRLFTAPEALPDEEALLARTRALLERLVEDHGAASPAPASPERSLALPLLGLGEVVGVLFVCRSEGVYEERHVRALSVVTSALAAYLSMLRASALEVERARQLEEAWQAAEKANRAKDEFLALVSHELRTPLSTILAWADVLRAKETRESDRARAFEAIERNVRAQAKLIDELLALTCIATATLRLDLGAVDPAGLIRETLATLRPEAEQKSIRLEAFLDESVGPLVADPYRLSQVVASLVANAIKFTPSGGRVEIHLERAGVLARIQVIDTGAGIDPALLPNVFDRFLQADSSSVREYGGLGVGLALVKDLVELHGGQVHAESPGEKRGATFTVELPLPGAVPEMLEPRKLPALVGIRVLVVDDDRDIGEVVQFVLESQGATVTVASSVADALAALERSLPDVLISDIAMPGESGHDLMRKIVARMGDRAPPAAALSAYAPGHDLHRSLASGFQMQLAKPIDLEALVSAVATLAGRIYPGPQA